MNNSFVVAKFVPGPAYIDDTVAVRRDLNRDGDFHDAGEGFLYYLTDQQHSTVALLDTAGNVVERYGYDAFGTPTIYDGGGTEIAASTVGNDRLYTGREWLPELGLYDYRQRLYNPATGRFINTDPAHDPANLGNPYTYVGNNPGAFVDPYGEWAWDNDWIQTGLELFGAGYLTGRGGAAAQSFWIESGSGLVSEMTRGLPALIDGGEWCQEPSVICFSPGVRVCSGLFSEPSSPEERVPRIDTYHFIGSLPARCSVFPRKPMSRGAQEGAPR